MDRRRKPPHFIVVVHGIGEQAYSQTTVDVVHRFAEVRQGALGGTRFQALLPANISSQSIRRVGKGYGWAEFRGIPVNPEDGREEVFDGTPAAETAGRNFRFVDLRWADILQAHQREFSSRVEGWTTALLDRLEPPFTPKNWIPGWMGPFLREVEATIIPFKRILNWYQPVVAKMIFDNILGDVHLYGDYGRTRGQAVRRFHATLDYIHLRDYEQWCRYERSHPEEQYVAPNYTVIAHSLGSVMSFDALTYAYAKPEIRMGTRRHASGSLPFPGYTEEEPDERMAWKALIHNIQVAPRRTGFPDGKMSWNKLRTLYPGLEEEFPTVPPLLWRNHVRHFITLGSPLDKFHVLWHHNYRHMGLAHHSCQPEWAADWMDHELTHRIQHYNLCDEQDPVGHHLEVTQETENYNDVFDTTIKLTYRDIVFRRYPVPGAAHTQYWKDQGLFSIILRSVLDVQRLDFSTTKGSETTIPKGTDRFVHSSFMEIPGFYIKALEWAYFRLPLITAIITGLLLSFGILGWYTHEFTLSYLMAIVVAGGLWMIPRPSKAIKKEMTPLETGMDKEAEEEDEALPLKQIGLWERWKPRPSLFANLVRGAVTWRRILIWLNQHENQAFTLEEALANDVRLSLTSDGGFKKNVKRRVAGGFLLLFLSAYLGMQGWESILDPHFTPEWVLRFLFVFTWVLFITTTCYLAVMAYVGIVFTRMKRISYRDRTFREPVGVPK